MSEGERLRTRNGKAARNERRKAFATTLNGLSAGALVAVVVQALAGAVGPYAVVAAAVLFVVAQLLLHYVLERVED